MTLDISNTQALQAIEQQLSQVQVHKQNIRGKKLELESAKSAVEQTSAAYKAIGNILVQKDPAQLALELDEEIQIFSLRQSALEKQEEKLQQKKKELQDAIKKQIEGENNAKRG